MVRLPYMGIVATLVVILAPVSAVALLPSTESALPDLGETSSPSTPLPDPLPTDPLPEADDVLPDLGDTSSEQDPGSGEGDPESDPPAEDPAADESPAPDDQPDYSAESDSEKSSDSKISPDLQSDLSPSGSKSGSSSKDGAAGLGSGFAGDGSGKAGFAVDSTFKDNPLALGVPGSPSFVGPPAEASDDASSGSPSEVVAVPGAGLVGVSAALGAAVLLLRRRLA